MDHVAASWVGLTDEAKELVESGNLSPFPVYGMPVGMIFNPSSPAAEVLCSYPADGTSAERMPDELGNNACGPMKGDWYFGNSPNLIGLSREMTDTYMADTKNGTQNLANEFAIASANATFNKYVGNWSQGQWWEEGPTWADDTGCTPIIENIQSSVLGKHGSAVRHIH